MNAFFSTEVVPEYAGGVGAAEKACMPVLAGAESGGGATNPSVAGDSAGVGGVMGGWARAVELVGDGTDSDRGTLVRVRKGTMLIHLGHEWHRGRVSPPLIAHQVHGIT